MAAFLAVPVFGKDAVFNRKTGLRKIFVAGMNYRDLV
jgi:hypothetical protein